jgi:Predicted membrane protein
MTDASAGQGRLPVIDGVRAVALYGVIAMNLTGMVMVFAAGQVITRAGPPDLAFGLFELLFIQGKARSMFAFLFGVGFGLLMSRTGPGFGAYFLRRMLLLLGIGVFNLSFLYWGDILIVYAICGMLLMLCRGWSQKTLLTVGLALVLAPPFVAGAAEILFGPLRGLNGQTAAEGWRWFESLRPIYEGSDYFAVMRANLQYYVAHNLFDTAYVAVYDLGVMGLFLLGLWTVRKGVFADVDRFRPFLRRVLWTCLPVGLLISAAYIAPDVAGIPMEGWIAGARRMAYVGLPILAFGYLALFTLWFSGSGRAVGRALAPMGRLALTGYLASNLIGGFVWYGWGLGRLGEWGMAQINLLALGVFLGLSVFAALWLRVFPIGPVEGLWRFLCGRRSRPDAADGAGAV